MNALLNMLAADPNVSADFKAAVYANEQARKVIEKTILILINAANNADDCARSVSNVHTLASRHMTDLGGSLNSTAETLRDWLKGAAAIAKAGAQQ